MDGAVDIREYRDQAFLPEAMLNYLARLGWSHGDQEIFALDEMIELFDIILSERVDNGSGLEKFRRRILSRLE